MKQFISGHKRALTAAAAIVAVIVVVAGLLGWNLQRSRASRAAQSTQQTTITAKPTPKKSSAKADVTAEASGNKILIVYFSRAGINYGNQNLKIGNTHRVADEITRVTKGDEVELKTVKPYPASYDQTVNQAQDEQTKNERPQLQNPLPDVSRYQTVFLGYPIWWSDIPMPVRTFMDAADLNGKTVIPFSTNEGSGWGNSLETLKKQYPKADLKKGFEIEGEQAAGANKQIDSWLAGLGYKG